MELRLFHKILSSDSVIEYIWQDTGLQLILNVGQKKENVLQVVEEATGYRAATQPVTQRTSYRSN